jgi:hypothetical protein
MSVAAILGPSFALVALLFVLMMRLAMLRVGAVRRREVRTRDVLLGEKNWPVAAIQAGNCVDNQFQLPVLFHVLTGFALVTHLADLLFVLLGWVFVALRVVHAVIHVGSNDLRRRFAAYAAGFFVLAAMWIIFAVRILVAL